MPQEPTPAVAPQAEAQAAARAAQAEAQTAARAAEADARAAAHEAGEAAIADVDPNVRVVVDLAKARAGITQAAAAAPVAAPRTAREVEGLNVRRDMLRGQLERAEEQRRELSRALQGVGDPEEGRTPDPAAVTALRAGLELRLRESDLRVIQLERDIAATERALTQASPEVLAQYEQQRPREPIQQGADEGEVMGLMLLAFVAGLVVLTLARRIRAWRRRRRGEPGFESAPAGVGPDPRIDRLTQAVDAIAVEVERIGEGQRFVTQLMAERKGLVPGEVDRTLDVPGVR